VSRSRRRRDGGGGSGMRRGGGIENEMETEEEGCGGSANEGWTSHACCVPQLEVGNRRWQHSRMLCTGLT
jgi:hypothetical protein